MTVICLGAGVPGSMRAESRMVIETVSKATSTSSMVTQQQQQQQIFTQLQQQQQIQQQMQSVQQFQPPAAVAVPIALPVDASKVTVSGNGLHQAAVNQETSFIVDGSLSGLSVCPSVRPMSLEILTS